MPVAPAHHASTPRAARQALWVVVPLVLSLLFVVSVAAWLEFTERRDRELQERTLIGDALTLQSSMAARIDAEKAQLVSLGRTLNPARLRGAQQPGPRLSEQRIAIDGLRRLWASITWLNNDNRIVDQLPEDAEPLPAALSDAPWRSTEVGISSHLWAPVLDADGATLGQVVARFRPSALLQQVVPWWIARRYDVRLVDSWGQVLSGHGESITNDGRASHRATLEASLQDTWLELVVRDHHTPWWQTLAAALMGVFLLLVSLATWMLRRQVQRVINAEAARRDELSFRQAMEESLSVGLRARDFEGRLVYVNRAFCELVGWPSEQLVGQRPPLPYWRNDAVDESLDRLQRNLVDGVPRHGYEATWVRKHGETIDVMILEAPLVNAQGQHVGWMGSVMDITQRKRLEDLAMQRSEAAAHQARLTTLGEVASALAHQLNQPLTAIAGYNAGIVRALEQGTFAHDSVLRAARELGRQADETGRIVHRIREFLTRRAPRLERSDPKAMVHNATSLFERSLRDETVTPVLRTSMAVPDVLADPVLIEQVIINLVRNAYDATRQRAVPAIITLGLSKAGERFVRVDVEDNGPGLLGRGIDDLCAPFYSTKPDGMGMGLAICRSIIESHHGVLDAADTSTGGARFSFTLPVASEADAWRPVAVPHFGANPA